jgi:excisionase family DNA binding protein
MELPKLLSVKEAAEALRVSQETVKRLTYKGKLKRVRVGNRVLIKQSDLMEFIENASS